MCKINSTAYFLVRMRVQLLQVTCMQQGGHQGLGKPGTCWAPVELYLRYSNRVAQSFQKFPPYPHHFCSLTCGNRAHVYFHPVHRRSAANVLRVLPLSLLHTHGCHVLAVLWRCAHYKSCLWMEDFKYLARMSRARRLGILKRARAMKVIEFPILAGSTDEYLGRDIEPSFVSFVALLNTLPLRF